MTSREFLNLLLERHNHFRNLHGNPPLELSNELNSYAQEWAGKLAQTNKLMHRPDAKYGENIFFISNSRPGFQVTGDMAVNAWYDEIKMHKFNSEDFNPKTGHFTQVIWKGSKKVGAGMAKKEPNSFFVVANYEPPGNMLGKFRTNVPPAKEFNPKTGNFTKVIWKGSKKVGAGMVKKEHKNFFIVANYEPPGNMLGKFKANVPPAIEIRIHKFTSEDFNSKTGHFTQVKWKGSKKVEAGMANKEPNSLFVVANYEPPGNMLGKFRTNVPPASHFTQVICNGSKKVEAGMANEEPNSFFVVVSYDPPGNMLGKCKANVPPASK
ncbi:glipr2 [Cordylochernes scorpioides]|uniref:Glipr2 n=1 Tax=Cordylochernes scorpioides TaxID=51811 RepID=A0ABY6KNZ5_9ARAC|nr:glipr2 [Cordylochernes scorpioides]